ncbi:Shedu anti-phage system protein SduA domain-containing protein [Desulfosudis oleivorans]|uniref:Shedu protein SduA C-terminal domain-containing protein n=1 Tax=Desulfosudis oleivorans (strain DSM 6200 / JCM 39069 / Hxd3) TaxID=96561 RepID=A8ZW03_DESOH|nr:Shedu anti-phage system protein SduA domain-containing protein [Desulfosudis oleivorans]ABW66712.1 hypothetical protein Dole_0902 [Desulfosudis oleivorans Hxd3]
MSLPPDSTLDDVKVRIRESVKNPNVGKTEQAVLKEGPRAFRLATLFEIMNPESGEIHHYSLRIDSINRKKAGWFYKPEKSVSLEGQNPNEIERLFRFLRAHLEGKLSVTTGDLHIIRSEEYEKLERLIDLIPNLSSPDMVELVKLIIPRIKDAGDYMPKFIEAFECADPQTLDHVAVATRFVKHKQAYDQLKRFVKSGHASESEFQDLLAKNPWMFGSEYSELLDRRTWTRDDNLDFMLRRTSDNYLEIIEIKTPFDEPLFLRDKSHDSYYTSSKLSPVLGQVIRYISEIERSRDSILSKDECDTLKIRARIIAGRDGSPNHQEALRNFNAHLHRIEVITFNQLVRIAGRVLNIFEDDSFSFEACTEDSVNEDIPF